MQSDPPKHVAIIMDGNGRWAQSQGLARIRGHEIGSQRVEELMRFAPHYGVKYLTLYAFSKENWQRPLHEVMFLMELLSGYLESKHDELMRNNVAFNAIGRIADLPEKIQKQIQRMKDDTRHNTGLVVTFCFSYSSRLEIVDACRKIAEKVVQGRLSPDQIDEKLISENLYTHNLPDPDLLIRTSGEMRISNFLLWQISYVELYVTDKCWPDFTEEEFEKAIQTYQKRERRFGRTAPLGQPQS